MSSIPQEIQNALGQLLLGLSSTDNNIRRQAEISLNKEWTKKDNIDVLLVFLAYQSVSGADDGAKSFAAVLFRRFAMKSPTEQYAVTARQIDYISDGAKQEIRNVLLQGFVSQQSNSVRHKLSDAIAEVAKDELFEWGDLLPTIFQAASNPDPSFRESAFRIISSAPEIIKSLLVLPLSPSLNNCLRPNGVS
ncbi:unnamed protein product [Ambrosiozyma monospora]|uniref:Unnamed protein product n=1 Tax=Ambrosiozyma monospora TaxID=43982 RepID=A0ACB5TNT2_AMBMO|nr:unnamed protein product [Ambrosiozyma monospora]